MKKFGLFTKNSTDTIKKVDIESLDLAISFFSKIKRLKKSDLVDIFIVKEIKN